MNRVDVSKWLDNGWFLAFFNVLVLWAINNVILGYCAQVLLANPIVYSCSTFMASALMMLLIAGQGPLVKETLRSIDTWVYGLVLILGYILTFKLLAYVSATEGSLLQRTSMVISLLLSWFFLARVPKREQIVGSLLATIGIVWIALYLPEDIRVWAVVLVVFSGLVQALRIFTTESHRTHKVAMTMNDRRARFRVVGFVMFVIGLMFWLMTFGFSVLEHYYPGVTGVKMIPSLHDFRDPASIFAGIITGVVLLTPFRLIEFSATSKIKTENYLAVSSLAPIATLAWGAALGPVLGVELMTVHGPVLYAAGALITLGAFVAALAGLKKASAGEKSASHKLAEVLEVVAQDFERVADSRDMLASTLEHFHGKYKKVADALGIPVAAVEALVADKEGVLAFKQEAFAMVSRRYMQKVAMSDALTGVMNRNGLMAAFKQMIYDHKKLAVVYIDLDKFKPINDTFGHEAGDAMLKEVARRLTVLLGASGRVARWGGDEFVVMLPGVGRTAAAKMVSKIKAEVAEPFAYKQTMLVVGASVGVALAPDDGTDMAILLKKADGSMYGEKHGQKRGSPR